MSQERARRRDRQVYLRSHPLLFALLAATRRRPTARIGMTVIAHSREAFTDALIRVPLDRSADGTTGGAAGRLAGGGLLFDQEGDDHRGSRRGLAESLGADGVTRLRPIWTEVLDRRLKPLADGHPVDLVDVAAELSGATAAALLGLTVNPLELASAARIAAAAGAREHLPGLPSPGRRRAAQRAADHLNALLSPPSQDAPTSPHPHDLPTHPSPGGPTASPHPDDHLARRHPDELVVNPHPDDLRTAAHPDDLRTAAHPDDLRCAAHPDNLRCAAHPDGFRTGSRPDSRRTAPEPDGLRTAPGPGNARVGPEAGTGLAAMLAVAAINTTVAGLPRAAAWCADADLWEYAETAPEALTSELLRVIAPTPLLPRVAADAGTVAGRPIRRGDRLILITRHAVGAHNRDPSPSDPAPPQVAQLVFGAGPHACPGARLARLQMIDTLTALAPYRPVVHTARADRTSALPSWATLIVTAAR